MGVANFTSQSQVNNTKKLNKFRPQTIPHVGIKMVGIDVNDEQLELLKSRFTVFSNHTTPLEHVVDFTTPNSNDIEIMQKIFNIDIKPLIGKYVLVCI